VKKTNRKVTRMASCSGERWTAGVDLGDRWSHYSNRERPGRTG
jgi:hypothetical protein